MHRPERRHTGIGRWGPVALYLAIALGWFVEGILAGAQDRLWLLILAMPAPAIYVWRTGQSRE